MGSNRCFLSHLWGGSTPIYGNGPPVKLTLAKCLERGDSCQTLEMAGGNHTGTHFDAPRHFDVKGRTISDYDPDFFVHEHVAIAWLDMPKGTLVTPKMLESAMRVEDEQNASLLLVRTGAATYRGATDFWQNGPGLGQGVAAFLRERFPRLTTVGMDCISVSSLPFRDIGRLVHREFLCEPRPILLIEDMNLEPLNGRVPAKVTALPLRIEGGDGAPCTVFAEMVKGARP